MTRDSGSERPQRTVAELLAEYGAAGGEAPRRRRRRSDDDDNSAPQTIIERVLSDSGKLLPIRDGQPPEPPRAGRRGGDHRPVGPQQPQPPRQQPPPQQPPPQQPQQQPPTGYGEPVRSPLGPPTGRGLPPTSPPLPGGPPPSQPMPSQPMSSQPLPSQHQQMPSQPMPSGPPSGQPMPPGSRSGLPPVRPATQPVAQPQVSRPAMKPVGPPTQQPLSRPGVSPVGRPPAGPPPMAARPPRPLDDDLATAINPPLPPDDFDPRSYPQQPSMQARLGAPTEANTEEFPLVPPSRPAATQLVAPVGPQGPTTRRPPVPPSMESTQAHPGPYVDDYDSDGAVDDFNAADDFNPSRDDYDDRPGRDRIDADDDDDVEPLSPGREWLLMGAQIGAGAIAGAVVFLAFSWLWGFQPIVAVLAALVVIVGLVFGVRRWRRADDLQTTALAILAGLVVTVSPAALLLVRR